MLTNCHCADGHTVVVRHPRLQVHMYESFLWAVAVIRHASSAPFMRQPCYKAADAPVYVHRYPFSRYITSIMPFEFKSLFPLFKFWQGALKWISCHLMSTAIKKTFGSPNYLTPDIHCSTSKCTNDGMQVEAGELMWWTLHNVSPILFSLFSFETWSIHRLVLKMLSISVLRISLANFPLLYPVKSYFYFVDFFQVKKENEWCEEKWESGRRSSCSSNPNSFSFPFIITLYSTELADFLVRLRLEG